MWKSSWTRWGCVLGFALGGFFDGILLHQVLQWHHLLSLVPGLSDIRVQVLWDGYFHALMYIIATVGLWGLWRAHKRAAEGCGRQLIGALSIGFGLWHVVDSVLSHWLLGIHRIKLDSPNPLVWDLIWFFAFGVTPLIVGWLLVRGTGPTQKISRSSVTLLLVAFMTVSAGGGSLRRPANQPFTAVVFSPNIRPPEVFAALASLDARLVWTDPSMGVIVVDIAPALRWRFYTRGALLVSGSGIPAGCFDWSKA